MRAQFVIPFEEAPEQPPELWIYAFAASGDLLDAAPLKENRAVIELGEARGRQPRILIAPPPPAEEKPTLASLRKQHAYEPVWKFNPRLEAQELLPIPQEIARRWVICICRARGRVVRPITIFGLNLTLPVCHARVHICEVDRLPLLIARLPDALIKRLRDELVIELAQPFVPPIPRPDPPPEQIAPRQRAALSERVAISPQPLPGAQRAAQVLLNPQPLPPRDQLAPQLPLELRTSLLSPATEVVRRALMSNVQLIYPLLCYWPWFWPWLTCAEIRVVETDDQGRFDTLIFYPCGGDKPDLYFWVEALIDGIWTTVYRPPMRCNTYWNYACGTEITIRVNDPRVGCWPHPPSLGPLVSVYGVGKDVAVEQIDADGYAPGITHKGVSVARRPFGHVLGLWADFNTDQLAAVGVTHYLWSYRPAGAYADPDVDGWQPIKAAFGRRYRADFPPSNSISKLYPFAPDPAANNTFPIPPESPWLADGASSGNWDDPSLHGIATAIFDTRALHDEDAPDKSGTYELKLELFRSDGSRVNLGSAGIAIQTWDMATANPDDWHNIGASNRYLVGGSLMGFQMVLHVDNNPLIAAVADVMVGSAAAGPCGFIQYGAAPAALAFDAGHLHNHAVFVFEITRGSSGVIERAKSQVGAAATDAVNTDPTDALPDMPIGSYTRSGNTYSRLAPVAQLLGSCGTQAAFAEQLVVYATATDGWYDWLYWLDQYPPIKAFALTPEE